ncbi:adhesion G protein-coupled receptor A3 [Prorops nasuta]|uniref:adhesion G protein-coupled receptor A3 n=1 Tax=Prorops nasuta TaxID=863751 RepID=UPI0034CE6FFB
MAASAVKDSIKLIMRTFLALIVLTQVKGIFSHSCPEQCLCKPFGSQEEGLRVKCNDPIQSIRDINITAISTELLSLNLSKTNIYIIEQNVFKNLTNLKRLDLSENKITSIDEEAFNGLENLERLDLSKNQISAIDSFAFRRLTNLKNLKLNENNITTLKEGTFYGLKSLKRLDLSDNPLECDCELYWFSTWIQNSSVKLSPPPMCASGFTTKGNTEKRLRLDDFHCQWPAPLVEVYPSKNQVVFAGDSVTLKCRAPSVTEDRSAKLSWLWYPNTTAENVDMNWYSDPRKKLANIKIENRYLSDSGIVDSSLNIVPVKMEHNGQWNCFLVSMNGNRSKAISIIVISDETQYCPLTITRNNKGIYAWPRTVVGWKAELPCEGNGLSGLMQISLKATYQCNTTGFWEDLDTESCPYISHTTKVLEQFSKVNLSLAKSTLLETAKRFKNYTGNGVALSDPVEINFITQTIENYLNFLTEEKELGNILIDIISSVMNLPKEILQIAENNFKSCTRLLKSVETITKFSPSIQSHKKNMALEEFKINSDSFNGLMCTWYSGITTESKEEDKLLYCATNNKTAPMNMKDKMVEASVQLPASLLHKIKQAAIQQLMVSMFSDSRIFPRVLDKNLDISTPVVGAKLIGATIQNLSEPIYIMLKVPFYKYANKIPRPVVWDQTDESSGWSSSGCKLSNFLNNLIIFHCYRLGYYALLQDVTDLNQNSLKIGAQFKFSHPAIYIGSFINISCLVFTIVTYILCYTSIGMQKKAKHCVINIWLSMTLLTFLYMIGIHQTENIQICQSVGLILHYLSLCCLLWMATSASNMYKKLSKPDITALPEDEMSEQPLPKPLLGLYLVGWGIGLIICGISGAINLREYAGYSYCFLNSGPALAALFIPALILSVYLIIFHLFIQCAIKNIDLNTQLSEGTQATENMDLELLEPNANIIGDRNSTHGTQTLSSEAEDPEHSQITQLKGQIIMFVLYLFSWTAAAMTTAKPLLPYISFGETAFAILYAVFNSTLGIFVLFFYGIARNDVRTQWLKTRCWFAKRKNHCCRTRNVSDANPVIPSQPLVQNLMGPLTNSQAAQVTSDTISVTSSRHTNRSQNISKTDHVYNQDTLPVASKMANVNLVVFHRQQHRSNNSVTTYAEPSSTCVEMFYNPHQSGVARKFFKKQRRHTKNNNLGPRKQGDGGATSDGGSCISVPRSGKLENDIECSILSSSAKVNNTNIHVEMNPITDTKNINILSDSGGSISEERNMPIRFVIGQETLLRSAKKINNDRIQEQPISGMPVQTMTCTKFQLSNPISESETDAKTDEEKFLRNVSQQCSLEYSSGIESNTQLNSERSDHNLPEIGESEEIREFRCSNSNDADVEQSRVFGWAYHSSSMYCLPVDSKPLQNSFRSSLNDVASITSSKNCEWSRPSLTDLQSTASSNFCDQAPESQKVLDQSEQSLSEINSLTSDNAFTLIQTKETYADSIANIIDHSKNSDKILIDQPVDLNNKDLNEVSGFASIKTMCNVEQWNLDEKVISEIADSSLRHIKANEYLKDDVLVKKETSV